MRAEWDRPWDDPTWKPKEWRFDWMHVFDSNILIYYLNGALPGALRARVDDRISDGSVISVIIRIEMLGFRQSN